MLSCMVDGSVVIGIGILIMVVLGFVFFSEMTGSVVTGSAINGEEAIGDFREDNIDELNEVNLNDTQNRSGQK